MVIQRQCSCGKGYASAYDNKCGHCRTKAEKHTHAKLMWKAANPNAEPQYGIRYTQQDGTEIAETTPRSSEEVNARRSFLLNMKVASPGSVKVWQLL